MDLLADTMLYALTYFPPLTYNRQGAYAAPDATEVYSGELQGAPGQVGAAARAAMTPAARCKGHYLPAGVLLQVNKQGELVVSGRLNLGPAANFNQADVAATGVYKHVGISLKTEQAHCLRTTAIPQSNAQTKMVNGGLSGTPSAGFVAGLAAAVNTCR